MLKYKAPVNIETLDKELRVKAVSSRVLLMTERLYADIGKAILRDFRDGTSAPDPQVPRLTKSRQDLFVKLLPEGFSPTFEPDEAAGKEIAYQVLRELPKPG